MSTPTLVAKELRADALPVGLADYMEANTDRSGDCWIWNGPTNGSGYGRFSFSGTHVYAHRAALALSVGAIPSGMYACHHCDTPPCVNPAHLYVGSNLDNVRDKEQRGRARHGHLYGLDHPAATIAPGVIASAVSRYLDGGVSQSEMARSLGVAQSTFGRWVRGENRADSGVGVAS